ncbi:MAG: hypothetical protein E2579_15990 [Pseudomonas sp.]|nr:hypothetical protein [Pseudomonas sp.]WJH59490.1 hypothetical protein FE254_26455 [Pseudomonas guguanensis]
MFSCSKIEQKQLNTWVSFQSAEQPLLGQFSVSGNSRTEPPPNQQAWHGPGKQKESTCPRHRLRG